MIRLKKLKASKLPSMDLNQLQPAVSLSANSSPWLRCECCWGASWRSDSSPTWWLVSSNGDVSAQRWQHVAQCLYKVQIFGKHHYPWVCYDHWRRCIWRVQFFAKHHYPWVCDGHWGQCLWRETVPFEEREEHLENASGSSSQFKRQNSCNGTGLAL